MTSLPATIADDCTGRPKHRMCPGEQGLAALCVAYIADEAYRCTEWTGFRPPRVFVFLLLNGESRAHLTVFYRTSWLRCYTALRRAFDAV